MVELADSGGQGDRRDGAAAVNENVISISCMNSFGQQEEKKRRKAERLDT